MDIAVICPHCRAGNPPGAAFCEQCGKALPAADMGTPRVVEGPDLASTQAGQSLQAGHLHGKSRKGSGALLAVAILQTIGAIVLPALLKSGAAVPGFEDGEPGETTVVTVILFGIAAVFWGLWWWSRTNPLPAAIVGLVLYLTIWFVDALAEPAGAFRGLIVRVIIVVVLVKAIQAGVQHRRLTRQMGGG